MYSTTNETLSWEMSRYARKLMGSNQGLPPWQ
jgi:hypothetical protein